MVNSRRNNQGGEDLPPPPPVTMEQLMMMQTQLLQQMAQNLQNMGHGNGNAPPQVRDKRGEFLKGHPPVFKHSTDPLQADDWLRAIERQLEIAQCDDKEKVLYASGQLQGVTLDRWDSFRFGRTEANPIIWQSFAVPSTLTMCLLD